MRKRSWVMCPKCNHKTRIQICEDTVLENFPLYCPKCKQETMVTIKLNNLITIKEPNAKT